MITVFAKIINLFIYLIEAFLLVAIFIPTYVVINTIIVFNGNVIILKVSYATTEHSTTKINK
jgi:hypothetical protein